MAKQKPASIRLYTDGSYYQKSPILGSAWIRANDGQPDEKRGYCINLGESNKSGSLLAEIAAVSQALQQLTKDLGSSKITIYTDCQVIRDTAYNNEYAYRAKNAKQLILADAWIDLGMQMNNHDANVVWAREEKEPKLAEAHEMAQVSANLHTENDDQTAHPYDIDILDMSAPQ